MTCPQWRLQTRRSDWGRTPCDQEDWQLLEKVIDTDDLPAAERLDAWRGVTSQSTVPTELHCDDSIAFRASMRATNLGATQLLGLTYSPLCSRRTPKLIRRSDPEQYVVALVRRGRQGIAQAGRAVVPDLGELILYCTSRPFEAKVLPDDPLAESLMVQVPRVLMPLSDNKVDRLLGMALPTTGGIGALLIRFMTHFASDTDPVHPVNRHRLGMVALDLVTALFAQHADDAASVPPETHQRVQFLRIQAFIRHHLGDLHLCPEDIAAAHHISVRTLHRIFQRNGLSVSAWIRHQRLEHARRDLIDPALLSTPVQVIAARWAFPDPTTFSRSFRNAYGVPPNTYRRHASSGTVPNG